MATNSSGTWRSVSKTSLALRPKDQTWNAGTRIAFAQKTTSDPRSMDAPAGSSITISGRSRYSHTATTAGSSSTPPRLDRDWDILEAEAFEPLYSPSTRRNLREGATTLSQAARDRDSKREEAIRQATSALDLESEDSFEDIPSDEGSAVSEASEETELEEPDEPLIEITHFIDEKLRIKAAKAAATSPEAFWKYTLYGDRSGKRAVVHYCTTIDSIKRITEHFLNEPVIGFDLEWNPSFTKTITNDSDRKAWWEAVSVMQLASQSHIAIFHFSEAVKRRKEEELLHLRSIEPEWSGELYIGPSEVIPPSLATLLEDRKTLKAGVNIGGDATRLRSNCSINCQGLFELSHMYRLVKFSESNTPKLINRKLVSMADQASNILMLPINKDAVRTSQWSQKLNKDQILYAASDAYAGLQLFIELDKRRRALDPRPPRPLPAEEGAPIRWVCRAQPEPEVEVEEPEEVSTTNGTTTTNAKASDDATSSADMAEFLQEANAFAESWHADASKQATSTRAGRTSTPSKGQLRSYFLWHNRTMEPTNIAKIYNIKSLTAASYIRQAIIVGKLPYDQARFNKLPNPVHYLNMGGKVI